MGVEWSKMGVDFHPVQDYNCARNYIKDFAIRKSKYVDYSNYKVYT